MNQDRNAIIYCRVSTKEQADNFSLNNQKEACHKYAHREGYTVTRCFINDEGESAKTANRKALQKMLQYAADHKGDVSAVIVWKYDRLSRNMQDYTGIIGSLGCMGITVLSATEQTDDSSSGKFMQNMFGVMAQFENDVKSERTTAGMKQAVKEGRWVWRPPAGYYMTKDALGKSILEPNEDAPFITEAFELAAKGVYQQTEICRILRREGFNIYNQKLAKILRSPVYAGLIVKDCWFDEPIQGIHPPLTSEQVFNRVQQILDGTKPDTRPRLRNHPDFPLRNFIICPECAARITGSSSTSHTKKRYQYYHCRDSGCGFGNVRTDALHAQFVDLLASVQPQRGTVDLFREIVSDVWKDGKEISAKERRRLKRRLGSLEEKRARANDLLLARTLPDTEYRKVIEDVRRQIVEVHTGLAELGDGQSDTKACIEHCQHMLLNASDLWQNADLDLRQRFQNFVFPKGIEYFNGSFGTPTTSIVFSLLQGDNAAESNMATPTGIEPVLPP